MTNKCLLTNYIYIHFNYAAILQLCSYSNNNELFYCDFILFVTNIGDNFKYLQLQLKYFAPKISLIS